MSNLNNKNQKINKTNDKGQMSCMNTNNRRNVSLEDLFREKREMQPSDQFWKSFDRKWEQTKGKAVIASPAQRVYSELSSVLVMALPRVQVLGVIVVLLLGIAFYCLPKYQNSTQVLLASYLQPHGDCQFVTEDLSIHSRCFENRFALVSDEVGSYSKNDLTQSVSTQGLAGAQVYQF